MPRSVDGPNLDRNNEWEYQPMSVKVGDLLTGGDVVGIVTETGLAKKRHIMVPANVHSRLASVNPAGH